MRDDRRYLKVGPRELSLEAGLLKIVHLDTPGPVYDLAWIYSPEAIDDAIEIAAAWLGVTDKRELRTRLDTGESVIVTPRLWITHGLNAGTTAG